MEILNKKINNIDNIIEQIKKNSFLKKTNQEKNINTIIEMNNNEKINLINKLDIIDKFSNLLENIINNNPNPTLLDKKLVNYINYEQYFVQNIK